MPNSNFGNIQYKASNGLIKLDELEGIVECFVSGIGNKDSVGDICATGAFAKSLQRRKPRVVWGHNWNDPIGKVLEIYEVPASDPRLPMKMKMAGIGGLYAKVQFNLQSEKGREAFANVAFFGEEQEWSIGYKTLRAQYDENLQANVLYEVELYEVSPVLHGANQLTGTISVKSDEEKMHGMMPMSISAPSSEPRRDGLFDEGVSQRISGPQLAGVVAELSRRAAGPVMVVEATENSIVFVKPGKGKFRIGYHFTGSEYMFGKPELIHAEQPKPAVQSGPSPIPGVAAKPSKPSTNNPAMAMPVAMKPVNGGMVMVPLAPVEYEGSDKNKKPELGAEEGELAESLVRIASKYGKFDEDGDGIWAGYYPPAENKVKDIGVKCSNCVLYQGEGKCKILDLKVEDEGKCRFAIIPDGVVVGYGKKQYSDILDDEEIKMIEDIEAKYPGEFILGTFRNLVKKRRKKRKSYKTLEEWGVEESELEEKGLDPFLANEYSYVIPVNLEDAFEFKSVIDPVLDYHRIDTTVNEYGIVINSPLSEESKDAITRAASSAYKVLKKKITSEEIEEKALGRRIAGRAIDRPNIGGKKRRGGRGLGIPSGDLDPRTRRDNNLDGTLFDNIPGWEQPDPTPGGPGSINNPKPSRSQLADSKKPSGKEKLSSGTRNMRRHADRSADMEKQFPNAEENQKRMDHEAIAKAWDDQGLGWEEVPRYNADNNLSSDFLRGREIGVNQARVMWSGDSVRKRPEKFNEKQRASNEYSNWYSSYAKSVSAYLDAHSRDDSDNWDGIESALRADVKSKYPDTQDWAKEDIATLNEYLNDIGLLDVDKLKKKKEEGWCRNRKRTRPSGTSQTQFRRQAFFW
jgi:HK97 family phage prohead protease